MGTKVSKEEIDAFDKYMCAVVAAYVQKGTHSNEQIAAQAAPIAYDMLRERRKVLEQIKEDGV